MAVLYRVCVYFLCVFWGARLLGKLKKIFGTIGNVDKTGENCMFESLRVETFRWNVSVGSQGEFMAAYSPQETSHRDVSTAAVRVFPFEPASLRRGKKSGCFLFNNSD